MKIGKISGNLVVTVAAMTILSWLGCCASTPSLIGSTPEQYPALYLSPGYLSKATTVPISGMKSTLRSYTHAKQDGLAIPAGPQCNIAHDQLEVLSVDFESVSVKPTNQTHLAVVIEGITPLQTTNVNFNVKCTFGDGAFVGNLNLPQSGQVNFTVDLGSKLQYNTSYVISSNGTVQLASPTLVHRITAKSSYAYSSQGFALDAFVASYFETVVAKSIEDQLTGMLTYPSPFALQWHNAAQEALSVTEFVCPQTTPGLVAETSSTVFYMQPGCGPVPPSSVPNFHAHTSLLATNDVMVLLPSSNGPETVVTRKSRSATPTPFRLLKKLRENLVALGKNELHSRALSSSSSSCSPVTGCQFLLNTTNPGLSLQLSSCTVCYPGEGYYTELAALATFQKEV